ncbi:unnamed protein product [Cunninghamella blakesleeana]
MPERVYIGNLARDASRSNLKDMFDPFGRILDLTVKNGFGFVEFNSKLDADEAVRECHGKKICGQRIVVEIAMKRRDNPRRENRERESYRLIVKNIPPKTTWQDLKDMMKKAGRVTFADILKDSDEGIVEFSRRDDMKYALSRYNNTKLNGQRVTLEEPGRRGSRSSRSRNYSRSPSRSRSRSRSPRRRDSRRRSSSRSVSNRRRSRSRSPMSRSRSRSRSISRSRSRSPRSPASRHSSPGRRDMSRSRSRSPRRSPSPDNDKERYEKDDK